MISQRKKMILKAIVEEYVKTTEPVGSKVLASRPEFCLNVSSATIRNDMMELEEEGLIQKTHLSSGRIPSEEGYRLYVQEILKEKDRNNPSFPMIDEIFEREAISREEAIKESMSLVAKLTNYASIVMGAAGYNARIKKLQFITLAERYGVILMVTDRGYVESKKIIIPENIDAKDMERVVNLLNSILVNSPISDIEKVLRQNITDDSIRNYLVYYDELVGALVQAFTDMAKDKYFLSGQSRILNQPEFQDVTKVKDLFQAIEQQEILKTVQASNNGITVRIGTDNVIKAMKDCTMISIPYEVDEGEYGAIAIVGPTRMEYQKIIPLLEYIAKNIKKVI